MIQSRLLAPKIRELRNSRNAAVEEEDPGQPIVNDVNKPEFEDPEAKDRYDRNLSENRPALVNRQPGDRRHSLNFEDEPKIKIRFYTNQSAMDRIRNIWLHNYTSATLIRTLMWLLKVLSCVMYIANFSVNTHTIIHCYKCPTTDGEHSKYLSLLWIERGLAYYIVDVVIAFISLLDMCMLIAVEFKGNVMEQIFSARVFLESLTSVPFIVSVCHPSLRYLYVPTFLNCWLAKSFLEVVVLYRAKENQGPQRDKGGVNHLKRLIIKLISFIICLAFTCMCGIHYVERIQSDTFDFFSSFWFVVVTFSTVGYGDMSPDGSIGKVFVIIMIVTALIFVPVQLEALSFAWSEKQKLGGSYSRRRAIKERHVVLCASYMSTDILEPFMNEFYAYPHLKNYYVILLCPKEFDGTISTMLENPAYSHRVIYMQGSVLKLECLVRAKVHYAECCFVLSSRNTKDMRMEDEATVLRAWSVKDFAPHVPLYVQILMPEHKQHVICADYVICEDELKYAVMASNCICPAMSTYISLLVHTLQGSASSGSNLRYAFDPTAHLSSENMTSDWETHYCWSMAQEIYDKKVGDSKFFKEYIGYNFIEAAYFAHKKYGVMLIGIEGSDFPLTLNPGPERILDATDRVIYFYVTSEDETEIEMVAHDKTTRRMSRVVPDKGEERNGDTRRLSTLQKLHKDVVQKAVKARQAVDPGSEEAKYIEGYPTAPYASFQAPICHLLPGSRPTCCLNLFKACDHKSFTSASEYNFKNKLTILCVENPSIAITNFIVPLRHHCRLKTKLSPIIIMTENSPDLSFLAAISIYPEVYYCLATVNSLNDLIRAGIINAQSLVVVDKESSKSAEETFLADSSSVVTVNNLSKIFPDLNILTELTYPTNMRFLGAVHKYTKQHGKQLSFSEKAQLEAVPQDQDLFQPAFVGGSALSTSMLDTLLYQSFVKPYIISVIYLLIGLKQNKGSGTLIFRNVELLSGEKQTFSEYYLRVIREFYEVPIGIFRKIPLPENEKVKMDEDQRVCDEQQIQILKDRMERLGIHEVPPPPKGESTENEDLNAHEYRKYVIVNPEPDTELINGDVVYLLRPDLLTDQERSEAADRADLAKRPQIPTENPYAVEEAVVNRSALDSTTAEESTTSPLEPTLVVRPNTSPRKNKSLPASRPATGKKSRAQTPGTPGFLRENSRASSPARI